LIYTFGSSLTKYYWPTWSDWLSVYRGPVTNLAYSGYDNVKIYWSIVDQLKHITSDDQVYIMWNGALTLSIWYDQDWIKKYDCWGFFPNEKGDLWYTNDIPWHGLYKQHPDHSVSLTQLFVSNLECVLNTQLLLDKIGCQYVMFYNLNPWVDFRPIYGKSYQTMWDKLISVDKNTVDIALNTIEFSPIKSLMSLIDWTKFKGIPDNVTELENYKGIWEYTLANKEYIVLQNKNDMHPIPLAHHDYLLEEILGMNPLDGIYRSQAMEMSKLCTHMEVPSWQTKDYIATPDTEMLLSKFYISKISS
jgi:hypothetical protein